MSYLWLTVLLLLWLVGVANQTSKVRQTALPFLSLFIAAIAILQVLRDLIHLISRQLALYVGWY